MPTFPETMFSHTVTDLKSWKVGLHWTSFQTRIAITLVDDEAQQPQPQLQSQPQLQTIDSLYLEKDPRQLVPFRMEGRPLWHQWCSVSLSGRGPNSRTDLQPMILVTHIQLVPSKEESAPPVQRRSWSWITNFTVLPKPYPPRRT